MLACPNISTKEWQDLEKAIGRREAFREYIKLNTGDIPSVTDIVPLSQLTFSKMENADNIKSLSEDVAKDMMEFLEKKFPGVNGNIINDRSKKWRAMLAEGKTPTINLAYAEMSDGFHEFSHPFLMALRKSNPETFNSLYNSLKDTPEWEEINKRATEKVERLYPELKGKGNPDLYKEEVLATAIGYAAELKLATSRNKISEKLGRIIDSIFKWINSFFTDFFANRIKTNDISPNTTFGEIIDMFVDTKSQIILDENWDKITDNLQIADAMAGMVTTNQDTITEQLATDIATAISADESFNLDEYINNWLEKTYKIPKRDYKPKKENPSQIAYMVAQDLISIAATKGYQLRGFNINERIALENKNQITYGVKDNTIEKLASVLKPIEFNYKFSNYLSGKKNTPIALNQPFVTFKEKEVVDETGKSYIERIPNIPVSLSEADAVLEFQNTVKEKYSDRKSISSEELNKEYIKWVTENYGINTTDAEGHMGYGMDRISKYPVGAYTRVLFVDDYINQNGHTFNINYTGLNGNGLGWYASAVVQSDRFDHEFQSDILPEVSKSYKQGEYFGGSGKQLIEGSKSDKVNDIATNKLNRLLQTSPDFLVLRHPWLYNQITKIDQDYINSRTAESYAPENPYQGFADFVELPFSKLDSYDPIEINRAIQFLTSELEVQIDEIKNMGYRFQSLHVLKGHNKMLNVFLSRKNDQQKALFEWINTFERSDNSKNIENDVDHLPFSKTEETPTKELLTNVGNVWYYMTAATYEKFPDFLKKIYDTQVEWANSNAPIKPIQPKDLNTFIRSMAVDAISSLLNNDGQIKKNYGRNKIKIRASRDAYRKKIDKVFSTYKFNKSRLKGLEFRRNIYSRPDAVIKMAEYYKGQYNRFYKFYSDIYESALPIAKEQVSDKKEDQSLSRYKKYNDLFYKWFDIIVPQSINSAKAEGRSYYYLPTAMAMNAIEGNNIAEKVYWTPNDNVVTAVGTNDSLKRSVTAFVSQNTQESTAVIREQLPSSVISRYDANTTAEQIAEDLISETNFKDSREFNLFLSTQSNLPTRPNGPLYTALIKYARKNNIKLTFDKPSWAKHNLIKVDLTGYTIKPIDRFSKLEFDPADSQQIETPEEQQARINNTIVKTLANNLSTNLGVVYNMVTPEQARGITQDTNTPWNGEPAFFLNGQVYFVEGNMTIDRVFHEFSHPFVEAIFNTNQKLFDNVYNALMDTPEGEVLSSNVAELYPELEQDSPGFKKEVLVRAMTHEAMAPSKSKGFSEFIKKLMFMIKQALRSVFGTPIKVEKLSPTTSLAELTKMLKTDKFDITPEAIKNQDVQYERSISDFTEALENVDDKEIMETIENYYKMVNSQISRLRKNKNYEDAREMLLDDETSSGMLQGIKLTLDSTAVIDRRLESLLNKNEIRKKNVDNLVHAILRMDAMTKKIMERIEDLKRNIDNKDNLTKIIYYDYLVKNWSRFLEDINLKLFDAGLDPLSKFGQALSGLKGRVDTTRRRIISSYGPGVVTILKESLAPLIKSIDDIYSQRIKALEEKGSNPKLIADTKKEWEETKLTDERILDLLTNKEGDTNIFSYYGEAYTNSPDPIVGGFAVYVKNAINKADAVAQEYMNDFIKDITPLLEEAGYSRTNFTGLMKKLVFRDIETSEDAATGELKNKEVITFLNPFKNVNNILMKYKHDIEKAKEEGNKELVDSIVKEQRKHLRDYFHQEYVKDYYEREAIYDTIEADPALKKMTYDLLGIDMKTATEDQKASAADFYSEVAKETYRDKYLLLNDIKEREGLNYFNQTSLEEAVEEVQLLWRDYSRMASLTDSKGSPKTGREYLKAQIERKYRKANNKYYEWVPITGAGNKPSFEFALRTYEQSLIDSEIAEGSDEYNEKKQKWIDKNTTIAFTKEFYDERNKVLTQLREVYATIPKNIRDNIDSTAEMEEMLDMATGFRDEDGQIIGSDMSVASKEKIRTLQQAVADKRNNMAGFSGLNKDEMEDLGKLYEKIIAKQKLTADERYRLQVLQDKQAVNGVDKATRAEINLLYKKLAELQSKEATDYYVNIVNEFLNDMGEPLIDNVTANDLGDPTMYVRLFNKNAEFAKWFKENHILKEVYDKESGENILVYDRLFVWNRTRPNDPDHYVKTTLSNGETIQGKPILSYFYRRVKDEFRTDKIVGKTVDNKNNWLPLTKAEGAKDDLYQNEGYDRLRREDPAAFAVLEKMKEHHLKFQENNPNSKKLYMQIPRYGANRLENAVKLGSRSNLRRILSNIKSIFFKRSDDYEDGFNLDMGNVAKLDLFESDIASVPVTGLYDLDPDVVSMNILDGMLKYMSSSVRQNELIDINPYAQAIKETVLSYKDKKGKDTTRAKAISNLYNREFKGEKLTGFLSGDGPLERFFQKQIGHVAKLTGTAFFALDIPSAIKNALAAQVEQFIEASGGRFLGPISLAKGKLIAHKVMALDGLMGAEYYRTKTRSLDMQLLQIFDPGQDYFQKSLGNTFGRSFASDFASGSWLMSPRKYLQYETTLEMFFGMLSHVKIDQTINGEKKQIPYIKAWELRDGQIKLKDGISQDWAPGGKEFNAFKNASHELTNRIEGTYAQFDQPEINRNYLLRQMLFMKKFFMSMAANHVSVKRPSAALGTISAGNYANLIRIIRNALPNWAGYIGYLGGQENLFNNRPGGYGLGYLKNMTKEEVASVRKLAAQVAANAAFYATLFFYFDFDSDDELKRNIARMKSRSGDALSKSFKMEGWLMNNAEVTLYKTLTEVQTWSHPIIAVKTTAGMVVQLPLFDRGITAPVKILYHTYGNIKGEGWSYYQKDSGPYPWQKEGGSKAVTELGKMIGLTGSTLDPVKSMKNHEQLARSLNDF